MSHNNLFFKKRVLVTGGTGSFGQFAIKKLLDAHTKEIIIYSRGEEKQQEVKRKFNDPKIKCFIGDVRNKERLLECSFGVDIILHAAAMKHVDICQKNPHEAFLTNVLGTKNVIDVAKEIGAKHMVNLSADKAAYPTSVYGATKLLSETLIEEAARNSTKTKFLNLRYSNVLGSSGSVVEVFRQKLIKGERIEILDKNAQRLVLNQSDVWNLLETALTKTKGGETFVYLAPKLFILDLAKVLKEQIGSGSLSIKSQLRSGEKIDAQLITSEEAKRTFLVKPNIAMIIPQNYPFKLKAKPYGKDGYGTDNAAVLDAKGIKKLLNQIVASTEGRFF